MKSLDSLCINFWKVQNFNFNIITRLSESLQRNVVHFKNFKKFSNVLNLKSKFSKLLELSCRLSLRFSAISCNLQCNSPKQLSNATLNCNSLNATNARKSASSDNLDQRQINWVISAAIENCFSEESGEFVYRKDLNKMAKVCSSSFLIFSSVFYFLRNLCLQKRDDPEWSAFGSSGAEVAIIWWRSLFIKLESNRIRSVWLCGLRGLCAALPRSDCRI